MMASMSNIHVVIDARCNTDGFEAAQAAIDSLSKTIGERVVPAFRALSSQMTAVILGPMATPRKRPRRIAKRIAQRNGRLRFKSAVMRDFSRGDS